VPRNELIESRIPRKDGTCTVLYGIPENSHVNMKLERRKEREKQEIIYFVRI
jgi:hypothetical protein